MSQMPYQSNVKSTYQADAFLKKILSNFFIFSFLLSWGGGGRPPGLDFNLFLVFIFYWRATTVLLHENKTEIDLYFFLAMLIPFDEQKYFWISKSFFVFQKCVEVHLFSSLSYIQIKKENEEIINTLFSRHTPYLLFCCWSCIGLNSWLDLTQPYYSILLNEPWSKNDKKLMLDQLTTWSLNLLTFDS